MAVTLIGMLDSPYVRRVAVSLALLDVAFIHEPLSVFKDFDRFRSVNPVVKAPTFLTEEGVSLMDSTLILDHVEYGVPPARRLMPEAPSERLRCLHVLGLALAAAEKTVQIVYERALRPEETRYEPWLERVVGQARAAFSALDDAFPAQGWLLGDRLTQADITSAIVWGFARSMVPDVVPASGYRILPGLSERAEALPAFRAWPAKAA
jgi:glutathione S-transferase